MFSGNLEFILYNNLSKQSVFRNPWVINSYVTQIYRAASKDEESECRSHFQFYVYIGVYICVHTSDHQAEFDITDSNVLKEVTVISFRCCWFVCDIRILLLMLCCAPVCCLLYFGTV